MTVNGTSMNDITELDEALILDSVQKTGRELVITVLLLRGISLIADEI